MHAAHPLRCMTLITSRALRKAIQPRIKRMDADKTNQTAFCYQSTLISVYRRLVMFRAFFSTAGEISRHQAAVAEEKKSWTINQKNS